MRRLPFLAAVPVTALAGYGVNEPPAVQLLDADGKPIAGAKISFTRTSGGGNITGALATTGSDGIATAGSWLVTLGANGATASLPAPFRVPPVSFTATGVAAAYQIDLVYLTSITPGRQAAFDSAAARWERTVYGDIPDIPLNVSAGSCFGNEPAINQTIDDLLIFVTVDSIDGPGAILGGASPCWIRLTGKLSIVGAMVFDSADVATLESLGYLDDVVLHEMGHVLGFGTLWQPGLLSLLVGGGTSDPFFSGGNGRAAFDGIGGTAYTGGGKVPVENTGGSGTRDSHWRESVFDNELMTGFLDGGGAVNPLSVVTVASLRDEGYLTNYAAADTYTHPFFTAPIPGAPPAPRGPRIALGNDILRVPIGTVDARGRVIHVYRP